MYKAFLYRLYPNKIQSLKLDRLLEIAREIYNAALQERNHAWKYHRKSINYYDQAGELKDLRHEIPEYAQLNYSATQNILRKVDIGYKFFFHQVKVKEKASCPRFRGKGRFNSITFPQSGKWGDGVKLKGNRLYIQNGGLVKVKMHRPLQGKIKTVTVKRECGKWYVIFSNTVDIEPAPVSDKVVGIDVGLEFFAVTSDGEYIQSPHYLRKSEAILRRSSRRMSRKKRHSHNWRKSALILAKKHLKVRRQRADFGHKVANNLVKKYGRIAVEELQIENMRSNHHLAKSISDAGWGQFVSILSYKAEYAGREFVQVNPNGTSQICSGCGETVLKSLKTRIHHCPNCGLSINRDLNAALNIKRLGLSLWDVTCDRSQCVSQEAVRFI